MVLYGAHPTLLDDEAILFSFQTHLNTGRMWMLNKGHVIFNGCT